MTPTGDPLTRPRTGGGPCKLNRCCSYCVLALAILLAAPLLPAAAQPPVAATGCPPELAEPLAARLRVELPSLSESARRALDEGRVRIELDCEPDAAVVRVRGAGAIEQRIEGDATTELRRIALAMVELTEASVEPAPLVDLEPAPESPAEPATSAAWVGLHGGVTVAGAPLLVLGAIGAVGEVPLVESMALALDVSLGLGRLGIPEGAIDVGAASLGVSLRFGGWLGIVELCAGPVVRGGVVVFVGAPSDPSARGGTHVGPSLGLGAAAGAGVLLGEHVRLGLDLEGGGIVAGTGALVSEALAARYGDFWLAARASVAWMIR